MYYLCLLGWLGLGQDYDGKTAWDRVSCVILLPS